MRRERVAPDWEKMAEERRAKEARIKQRREANRQALAILLDCSWTEAELKKLVVAGLKE